MYIPSSSKLTTDELIRVINVIKEAYESVR
jgi:hypothetical protein